MCPPAVQLSSMDEKSAGSRNERMLLEAQQPVLQKAPDDVILRALAGELVDNLTVAAVPKPAPAPASSPSRAPSANKTRAVKAKAKSEKRNWAMEGLGSLEIDLHTSGYAVEFRSLGEQAQLDVQVVNQKRRTALVWGLAVAVFVVGLSLSAAKARRKLRYVIAVLIMASIVPAIPGLLGWADVMNGVFYAGCLLIVYYLFSFPFVKLWQRMRRMPKSVSPATTAVMLLGIVMAWGGLLIETDAAEQTAVPYTPVPQPIAVPADAVVIPYMPGSTNGTEKVLIPYERYRALYDLAHPDEARKHTKPPVNYALAGSTYKTRLEGEDVLLVDGVIDLEVFVDDYVEIPFVIAGGVFAKATLDGQPARIKMVQPTVQPKGKAQVRQQAEAKAAPPLSVLYVKGKGRHTLDLSVQLKLERRGGWRVVNGRLPVTPATRVELLVPDAGTEVSLRAVTDRPSRKTVVDQETVTTTLGTNGELAMQWRPEINEGEVDRTLTVNSQGLFDVQEDHFRLTWEVALNFRRGEREFFDLQVPADYLVEKVEGLNVRGWELDTKGDQQHVKVRLLKRIKLQEKFTLHLRKNVESSLGEAFSVPQVEIADAIRHTGHLVVRRSPYLRLRTAEVKGLRRSDLGQPGEKALISQVNNDSPLGIRSHEAYDFVAVPFSIQLFPEEVFPEVVADTKGILRVAKRERQVEARVGLQIQYRPLYEIQLALPADFLLEEILAPVPIEWERADAGEGKQLVTVHFSGGISGSQSLVLLGPLGEPEERLSIEIPQVEVYGALRQQGQWVVQTDPGYDVQTSDLSGLENVLLSRVHGWLSAGQRSFARTALQFREADYSGKVSLIARKPIVSAYTVSNTRVTDRAIEDTIILSFNIQKAGIREVEFRLPAYLADARIEVPLLREKVVTPVDGRDQVLVKLTLQDEVINQLRVLVEHDRLLDGTSFSAAIPEVLTGRTDRRYVTRESAGRDEVVNQELIGLESLTPQMKEWATVAPYLKGGSAEAWLVSPGAQSPVLTMSTRQRVKVQTAGATIGLAQTVLLMDTAGTYRGEQTYHVDNRTEQFLAVDVPEGASLWTAKVAGEFVKPNLPDASKPHRVHIPLVKTAEGDLDFKVILKYGGRQSRLKRIGKVDFPFIQTRNINVELSQVELRLPTTHQWLQFGGTMRLEEEVGQLEAGQMRYMNKQAKRLVQTLQYGDEFSKARANNAWGKLQVDLADNAFNNSKDILGNYQVVDEAKAANQLLEEATRQIQKNDDEVAAILDVDNRKNFNEAFSLQSFQCSANLVNTLAGNFDAAAVELQSQNAIGFNDAWFANNGLVNAQVDVNASEIGGRFVNPNQVDAAQGQSFGNYSFNLPQGAQQQQQLSQAGQTVYYADVTGFQKVEQAANMPGQRGTVTKGKKVITRRGQGELALKYQERLQEQDQVDGGANYYSITVSNGVENGGFGSGSGSVGGGGGAGGEAASAVGAGLASLDVTLPGVDDARWVRYQFTTPRGEVQVVARAAGLPMLHALKRVGVLAALGVLFILLRPLFRRRSINMRGRKMFSTCLILLGVAGLLVGVLPLAALVLLIAGIVLKVSGKVAVASN